ncbi:MAG TPA: hypothetical protein VK043_02755 [Burkholderiales bacterium]|jgi:hypothetical protein|nr:hypothetical protein [Burkholderiales bacterium]
MVHARVTGPAMVHVRLALITIAMLAFAAGWILVLGHLGAERIRPGENLIAVFPPSVHASQVIGHLAAARARQFEPLGAGNTWVVQAGAPGLAPALRSRGALLVLQARGPVHFALGCAPGAPL